MNRQAFYFFSAFLCGLSSLGSETAYFKLLDYTVGSTSIVYFIVVAIFILGLGLGSLYSTTIRRLWPFELILAAINFFIAFNLDLVPQWNSYLMGALAVYTEPYTASVILGSAYLVVPTFLLGLSLPWIGEATKQLKKVYFLHAAGSFLGIAFIETIVYPFGGLFETFLLLGLIHLLTAALLKNGRLPLLFKPKIKSWPRPLLIAGIATGAFQGMWLISASLIFRPYYYTAPTVVAFFLAGIFVGSHVATQTQMTWKTAVRLSLGGLALSNIFVFLWVELFKIPPPENALWVVMQAGVLLLPAVIPIGMLFPAFFTRTDVSRDDSGSALLTLSLGNSLGVLIAGFLLTSFTPPFIGLGLAPLPLLILLKRKPNFVAITGLTVTAMALVCLLNIQESSYLSRSRTRGLSKAQIDKAFYGPGEVTFVIHNGKDSYRHLYQNGHSGWSFSPQHMKYESLVGGQGLAYSPTLNKGLVLGAGYGRTAGFVAQVMHKTDVIDIGYRVPDVLHYLSDVNYNLLDNPSVRFYSWDAILAPALLEKHSYDLVVNTVLPFFVDKAAKLFTEEYFHHIQRLLKPNGVFVTWLTRAIPTDAYQALINTGQKSFKHCRLINNWHMKSPHPENYLLQVCSNTKLRFDPSRLLNTPVSNDPAARELIKTGRERVINIRLHDTTKTHSLFNPYPKVLLGGYY